MPLWQYQQKAEPIPTPTTSPAVVSLEWVAQWPDRLPPPPHRLARIIHQPKKSTRENPFGGQMILTTLISQDHHAPKARSSDGLDSVQSGLSVVSRRTSSWQPPRADHHRFVRDPPEVSMALTGPATSDAPTLTTLHSALRLARLGT